MSTRSAYDEPWRWNSSPAGEPGMIAPKIIERPVKLVGLGGPVQEVIERPVG